jgi:hypothetical protein
MTSHCRSCAAPIRWAKTLNGKAMPLDAEPNSAGNITLKETDDPRAPQARVLAGADLFDARAAGTTLYLSHYATCPDGEKWRRRR